MGEFRIGCAVWAYKGWVGELFPAGSRNTDFLRLYSRRMTTVEGNTTFYAIPGPDMVARWAQETPPEFQFCFKIPQSISHAGKLADGIAATQAFLKRLEPLGSRLGPFFLQLPPNYRPSALADLQNWLAAWPHEFGLAVEVRHLDWFAAPGEQQLMELLTHQNVGRVLMDVRPLDFGPLPGQEQDLRRARDNKPAVPLHPLRSSNLVLLRYIGHPEHELNATLLDEWANRLAQWLAEGNHVYCFMHCPDEARSPALCRALYRRLQALTALPPLPWETIESAQQQSLF